MGVWFWCNHGGDYHSVLVVISYGVGVSNQVQMDGDGDSALIEESTGIHLLEINESG